MRNIPDSMVSSMNELAYAIYSGFTILYRDVPRDPSFRESVRARLERDVNAMEPQEREEWERNAGRLVKILSEGQREEDSETMRVLESYRDRVIIAAELADRIYEKNPGLRPDDEPVGPN